MIAGRVREALEPLLCLYRRDSTLRGPMLSGTIPALLFALGLLLLALADLLGGDSQEAWRAAIAAPVVFANWFILGFVIAVVIGWLDRRRSR